jgi:hypothetical protein
MKCERCGYVMTAHCGEWFCERCIYLRDATPDEQADNALQERMQSCILDQHLDDEDEQYEPVRSRRMDEEPDYEGER